VFCGSTDSQVFEDYIEQLLQHCGKWPELKSVIVMDKASFSSLRAGRADVFRSWCKAGVFAFIFSRLESDRGVIS
jgi:hypothetical protein